MKLNYIIIPLITIFVASLGGQLTSSGINNGWYDSIAKPAWTPPGSIIGVVWTTLFILATISALIVWNRMPRGRRFNWIIVVFVINASLNVFWSFLFFNQHLIGPAVWEAGLLGLSAVALIILIWPSDLAQDKPILRLASSLLIPYVIWVVFATFLTYSVWALQPSEAPNSVINSFEECVSAGYPVLESYPRQCRTPDGRTFLETMKIKVYFNNDRLDPEFSCNKVFPIEREILKTKAVARTALEELLKGVTEEEKAQGFFSNINPGVKIQKLVIGNGVAKVDFDEQLEFQVGGSCRVAAIRAEITETLKQFPTIDGVIISINGRTEDILQP